MSDEFFSASQLAQIALVVKEAVREELADSGLRLDGADHVDEAREDFRFLRRMRKGIDGTAAKVGWVVIAALLSGVIWLITAGANAWKGMT